MTTTRTQQGAFLRGQDFARECRISAPVSMVLKWRKSLKEGWSVLALSFDVEVCRFAYDREARDLHDAALALYHDGNIAEYLDNSPPSVEHNAIDDLEGRLTVAEETIAALRDKLDDRRSVSHCVHCGGFLARVSDSSEVDDG